MTGTDHERRRRRCWAAEQLGLATDASADDLCAAWLRMLPDEEFVPSPSSRWALRTFLGRGGESEKRADEVAAQKEEEQLRDEVEAFAQVFWDLPAEERGPRWQALMDRCTFPALSARLNQLMRDVHAIPMPSAPAADARMIELAEHVRELFVLRPGPRARARQTLLRRMRSEHEEWKAAARRLRHGYPALCTLGNDLLDRLQTGPAGPDRLPRKPPPQPKPVSAGGEKSSRWPIWVIVVIAGAILRAATGFNSHSTPTYPLPHPPYEVDKLLEQKQIREEEWKKWLKQPQPEWPQKKPGDKRKGPDGPIP